MDQIDLLKNLKKKTLINIFIYILYIYNIFLISYLKIYELRDRP